MLERTRRLLVHLEAGARAPLQVRTLDRVARRAEALRRAVSGSRAALLPIGRVWLADDAAEVETLVPSEAVLPASGADAATEKRPVMSGRSERMVPAPAAEGDSRRLVAASRDSGRLM